MRVIGCRFVMNHRARGISAMRDGLGGRPTLMAVSLNDLPRRAAREGHVALQGTTRTDDREGLCQTKRTGSGSG